MVEAPSTARIIAALRRTRAELEVEESQATQPAASSRVAGLRGPAGSSAALAFERGGVALTGVAGKPWSQVEPCLRRQHCQIANHLTSPLAARPRAPIL